MLCSALQFVRSICQSLTLPPVVLEWAPHHLALVHPQEWFQRPDLPTERNSHAAVAIDSDLLVLGGESNAELVQEMCMIDTEKQVQHSCHQLSSSRKSVIAIAVMSLVFCQCIMHSVEDAVDAVLL